MSVGVFMCPQFQKLPSSIVVKYAIDNLDRNVGMSIRLLTVLSFSGILIFCDGRFSVTSVIAVNII